MRPDQFIRESTRSTARALPRQPGRRLRGSRPDPAGGGEELLAMVGHEMRNPLGAITAAAQVLQMTDPDPHTADEARAVLVRQARLLGDIMDAMQDLGRAKAGKLPLERAPLALADLVRAACAALVSRRVLAEDAIQLDLDPAWVEGDATRLQESIATLAADALRGATASAPVRVSLRLVPSAAVLELRAATGDAPVPRQSVRALLALKVLEMHGAHVVCSSGGLTVRLRARAATGDPLPRPRGQRVLMIENEAGSLCGISAQLALDGHVVSTVCGAAEGLQGLRQSNPPLCMVDLTSGEAGGFELARRARACGYAGRMIGLDGGHATGIERTARAAGFDACLPLGAEPAQLRRVIGET